MATRALGIWMNGERVGTWATTRTGTPAFLYDDAWLASPAARALSLSMPVTSSREVRGAVVDHYFDNLLPDSAEIRRRLGTRFKAASASAFDLLAAIGRDCVGAVQLLPDDETPAGWNRIDSTSLTPGDVARHLAAVTSPVPFGSGADEADFRISLAGAQEKTALLRIGTRWHRPHGATPTTHIVKLPLGLVGNLRADMSLSVENEWLCAQLLGAMGLPVADTAMAQFGEQRALVVTRFDRRWQNTDDAAAGRRGFSPPAGAWIARLPQEDFCQALGLPPTRKYEADGGPGIDEGLRLLATSDNAEADRLTFLQAQFAFWLLAATDGHAKNFSIAHRRGGGFVMTPLYDVLSAWPIIGSGGRQLAYRRARLAMALRGTSPHDHLHEIKARHWAALAGRSGLPHAWDAFVAMAEGLPATLDDVQGRLPVGFPDTVWAPVAAGLRRHAAQFLREAGSAARAA